MKFYSVTLFGNRNGATVDRDYGVGLETNYSTARKLIKENGGWGNIREFYTYIDALKSNNDFILEIMAQCLSIKQV